MMESADVVQAIFRSLGISGWETVGTEPAHDPTRPGVEDSSEPEIPRSTAKPRSPSKARVVALAPDPVG